MSLRRYCPTTVVNGNCSGTAKLLNSTKTATIVGSVGGRVNLPTGEGVFIEPGAFFGTKNITVRLFDEIPKPSATQTGVSANGQVLELGPDGLVFIAPVVVTTKVAAFDEGLNVPNVHVYNYNDDTWDALKSQIHRPSGSTGPVYVNATIAHFSLYATMLTAIKQTPAPTPAPLVNEPADPLLAVDKRTSQLLWVILVSVLVPLLVCGGGGAMLLLLIRRRSKDGKEHKKGDLFRDAFGAIESALHMKPKREELSPVTCHVLMTRGGTPPPQGEDAKEVAKAVSGAFSKLFEQDLEPSRTSSGGSTGPASLALLLEDKAPSKKQPFESASKLGRAPQMPPRPPQDVPPPDHDSAELERQRQELQNDVMFRIESQKKKIGELHIFTCICYTHTLCFRPCALLSMCAFRSNYLTSAEKPRSDAVHQYVKDISSRYSKVRKGKEATTPVEFHDITYTKELVGPVASAAGADGQPRIDVSIGVGGAERSEKFVRKDDKKIDVERAIIDQQDAVGSVELVMLDSASSTPSRGSRSSGGFSLSGKLPLGRGKKKATSAAKHGGADAEEFVPEAAESVPGPQQPSSSKPTATKEEEEISVASQSSRSRKRFQVSLAGAAKHMDDADEPSPEDGEAVKPITEQDAKVSDSELKDDSEPWAPWDMFKKPASISKQDAGVPATPEAPKSIWSMLATEQESSAAAAPPPPPPPSAGGSRLPNADDLMSMLGNIMSQSVQGAAKDIKSIRDGSEPGSVTGSEASAKRGAGAAPLTAMSKVSSSNKAVEAGPQPSIKHSRPPSKAPAAPSNAAAPTPTQARPAVAMPKDMSAFVAGIAAKHGKGSATAKGGTEDGEEEVDEGVLEAHKQALAARQGRMMERLQRRQAAQARKAGKGKTSSMRGSPK